MNRLILMAAAGLFLGPVSVSAQGADPRQEALEDTVRSGTADPAGAVDEEAKGPRVTFEIHLEDEKRRDSLLGVVTLVLNEARAPKHTANFLKLVQDGYYEGVAFHRIVPAFIVQGGDPKSRVNWQAPDLGTGGPGYTLPAEIGLPHVRGALVSARLSDAVNPDRESNGSQFYICLSDLPSLDTAGYSVFGRVVEGMDVMDRVAKVRNAGSRNQNRALSRVYMKHVAVQKK